MVITFQAPNTSGIVAEFAKNSDFPTTECGFVTRNYRTAPF